MEGVERDPAALQEALRLGREMADRHGGWGAAPGWLNLEHARLLLQADSLRAAEAAAQLVLERRRRTGRRRQPLHRADGVAPRADHSSAVGLCTRR